MDGSSALPSRSPSGDLVLCADDYGVSRGVDRAIEELVAAGRLTAVSCMTGLAGWRRDVAHLQRVARDRADVGVHLTLTTYRPVSAMPKLAPAGLLPSLSALLLRAYLRQVPRGEIRAEVRAQLDAFEDHWGGPPDYVDGHQHVHLLPGIRDELLDELAIRYAQRPYLRNCRERVSTCLRRGVAPGKACFVALLSRRLAARARAAGFPMNSGFSGLHDFSLSPPFRERMQRFLRHPGPRPLVHVHPGYPDPSLAEDPIRGSREAERAYLASDDFPRDLAAAKVCLRRFAAPP